MSGKEHVNTCLTGVSSANDEWRKNITWSVVCTSVHPSRVGDCMICREASMWVSLLDCFTGLFAQRWPAPFESSRVVIALHQAAWGEGISLGFEHLVAKPYPCRGHKDAWCNGAVCNIVGSSIIETRTHFLDTPSVIMV